MKFESEQRNECELFLAAIQLSDPQSRDRFLVEIGTTQPALAERVRRLIAAGEQSSNSLLNRAVRISEGPVRSSGNTTWSHSHRGEVIHHIDIEKQPMVGRYQLLEEIGSGGMGTVYVASQLEPVKRRVAVKVINPGMNSRQVLRRFEAERQALAVMDHPNIARVLDGGTTDSGLPYFVMELVRGISILKFCRRKELSVRERLELFIDVCGAVQHAHQKGIIHRDLKPSNILVETHDDSVVPKIIDFGISKAVGNGRPENQNFTGFHEVLGTPMYMSPEQAEFHAIDVDTRSDVYSLGVLLYELVAHQPPFDPERIKTAAYSELFQIIREETPPRPSSRATVRNSVDQTAASSQESALIAESSRLRTELDWIVMKAMEKSRLRRYQSARELGDDVRRFLNHEPITARPPSVVYRLQKTARRHRAAIGGSIAAALALIIGTVAALWQAHKANEALKLAEDRNEEVAIAYARLQKQVLIAEKARTKANELLYATEVRLAGEALNNGDINRAQNLLLRQLDPERVTLTQSFEWQFLQHLVEVKADWNNPPVGEVRSMRLSPDGRLVAVAAKDSVLRILDAATGKPVCEHLAWTVLNSAAWSPDGKQIVCACANGTVKLFAFRESEGSDDENEPVGYELTPLRSLVAQTDPSKGNFRDDGGEANDALFTPDGNFLLTTGDDTIVRVWNRKEETLFKQLTGNDRAIERLALSPDGLCLATASSDSTFRLWDLTDFQQCGNKMNLPSRVVSTAFSVDGSLVAAGCISGDVIVVETGSGKISRHKVLDGIECLGFLSCPTRLVAGDRAGIIRSWELTGTAGDRFPEQESLTWSADKTRIQALVADDQHDRIFSGSRGGRIALWPAQKSAAFFQVPSIEAAKFSSDGDLLLGSHQLIRLTRGSSRVQGTEPLSVAGWELIAASSDSHRVILASDSEVLVYDEKANEPISRWDCTKDIYRLALSPDGSVAATVGYQADVVELRNASSGEIIRRIQVEACRCLEFSPRGDLLAVGHLDNVVMHPLDSDKETVVLAGHSNTLRSVSFSPDGDRIATGSDDRHIRIWEPETGELIVDVAAHSGAVHSVKYSADGTRLVSGSETGHVRVWHAESMQRLLDLTLPQDASVATAALSPDNLRLAVRDEDEILTVFEAEIDRRPANGLPAGARNIHVSDFDALGDLEGGLFRSLPASISADGQLVVGLSHHDQGFSPFVWCEGNGIQPVGPTFPNSQNGECACVSDDHLVFGGAGGLPDEKGYSARVWFADGTTRRIAEGHGMVVDMSADSQHMVGHVGTLPRQRPFQSISNEFEWLPLPDRYQFGVIAANTADGKTVVGTVYKIADGCMKQEDKPRRNWRLAQPAIWVNGKLRDLTGFDEHWNWKAVDISDDGKTIVGCCWAPGDGMRDPGARMFIWRDGDLKIVEPPKGFLEIQPRAVSGDGNVVVGAVGLSATDATSHAFHWTFDEGIVDLNEAQTGNPGTINWTLVDALDVSANGRYVAGYGVNPEGNLEAFRLGLSD